MEPQSFFIGNLLLYFEPQVLTCRVVAGGADSLDERDLSFRGLMSATQDKIVGLKEKKVEKAS